MFWATEPRGVEWKGVLAICMFNGSALSAAAARNVANPATDQVGSIFNGAIIETSIPGNNNLGTWHGHLGGGFWRRFVKSVNATVSSAYS